MSASPPINYARLDDATAAAFARPETLVGADTGATNRLGEVAATYYGFWNNGSTVLFEASVSPDYTDCTLPAGRRQGSVGLADAATAFFAAFPDGRVRVMQQLLVGDRVVSHLRITGSFTRIRDGTRGGGQSINYLATDILRIADGLIVENWHVEDHETLRRQLAETTSSDRVTGSGRQGLRDWHQEQTA